MPEPIEAHLPTAAVLADTLARQAAALHVMFMRGFLELLLDKKRSLRDVSRTLKAQNQCRKAFKLLLALSAMEQLQKKSQNRTNRLLSEEIRHRGQGLGKPPQSTRLCPVKTPSQGIGVVGRKAGPAGGADPRVGAVEKVDRSPIQLGQGPLRTQSAQARTQKPRLYRTEARGTAAPPRLGPHHRPREGPPPHPLSHPICGRRRRPARQINPQPHRPLVGRSKRRREARRFGWRESLQRPRSFARSPPRCLEPGRRMRRSPWHGPGSRAILPAKSVR